ncbi:MAG: peptide-binding protein, partial [Deltaproteobacteria bacterium]
MRRFERRVFLIVLAVFLFALSSCGKSQEKLPGDVKEVVTGESGGKPAYGDAIVFGSIGDISGLIPHITSDSASHEVGSFIYNGLVRYDKNLNLEGELAESWEIKEGGLKIVFHLRKGVKWHDGKPFTSEDVLFTYNLMRDPKTPTAYAEDFLQVKRAYAPDPYTFVVEYEKPFAPALASWGIWILPKHRLEGVEDIVHSEQNRNPIGTGPYRFVEWKTGEKVVLEANPDYFEGRPHIQRVIYRIIPDQATMFLELKSGGIDFMNLTPLQY